MAVHGIQKLQMYDKLSKGFPDPIGLGSELSVNLAIGAELGCSILLIVGLLTRLSLIPLAFTMIVAGFIVHSADTWKIKELAFFYLACYVGLFITGPGALSVDGLLFQKKDAD